jgi:hypothetical protein
VRKFAQSCHPAGDSWEGVSAQVDDADVPGEISRCKLQSLKFNKSLVHKEAS